VRNCGVSAGCAQRSVAKVAERGQSQDGYRSDQNLLVGARSTGIIYSQCRKGRGIASARRTESWNWNWSGIVRCIVYDFGGLQFNDLVLFRWKRR
jgi:hypothetical protein